MDLSKILFHLSHALVVMFNGYLYRSQPKIGVPALFKKKTYNLY